MGVMKLKPKIKADPALGKPECRRSHLGGSHYPRRPRRPVDIDLTSVIKPAGSKGKT
jgi:hypothetical protein